LLFMLSIFCGKEGVSVVVMPLIALWQDMKQRCWTMKIKCRKWKSRYSSNMIKMILVIPESIIDNVFRIFLNRMKMM
jgi:hypothetical protein